DRVSKNSRFMYFFATVYAPLSSNQPILNVRFSVIIKALFCAHLHKTIIPFCVHSITALL
ncbi:hypothetical protein, partial [Shewanella colwelliana]|uniref:hypothetical protein n=1 Tax=Shewanella colwelliana TaxID=23 RepID=UPI001C7D5089